MAEELKKVIAGDTVKLRCEFGTWGGALADPESVVLSVYAPQKATIIDQIPLGPTNKVGTGIYEYDYPTNPASLQFRNNRQCVLVYEFKGILEGTPIIGQGKFELVSILED